MFNMHTHSTHSHDGKNTVFEMCEEAYKRGLKGIAITDHVDLTLYKLRNVFNEISKSIEDAIQAKKQYANKMKVLVGLEMGEATLEPIKAKEIYSLKGVDFILLSRHFMPSFSYESEFGFSDIPLWSTKKLDRFCEEYYTAILDAVKNTDFDSVAHLTLPLRYFNGKYNKGYDLTKFDNLIKEILKSVVKQKKALEINTSNFINYNIFMPDEYYIKMFLSLGGKYFTVGSDAHNTTNMANGLKEGYNLLKSLGVEEYCYFENRKIVLEKI